MPGFDLLVAALLWLGLGSLAFLVVLRREPTAVRVDGTHLRTRVGDLPLGEVESADVLPWSAVWRRDPLHGEVVVRQLHGRWLLHRMVRARQRSGDGAVKVWRIAARRPVALAAALAVGSTGPGLTSRSQSSPVRFAQGPVAHRGALRLGAGGLLIMVVVLFRVEDPVDGAVPVMLLFVAAMTAFIALLGETSVPTAVRVDDEAVRTDRGDIPLRAVVDVEALGAIAALRREMSHAGWQASLHWSRNLHGGQATFLPGVAIRERLPDGEIVGWQIASLRPGELAEAIEAGRRGR